MAAVPRRDKQGRILIPLADAGARRVVFLWKVDVNGRTIPLPALLQGKVPTLLTVFTPDPAQVQAALKAVACDSLELGRLERMGREIGERVGKFDRTSSRDRAALLRSLMRFEIQARATERAAGWGGGNAGGISPQVRAARVALAESLAAAGLDDFTASARSRVGLAPDDPMPDQPAAPEPPAPLRIHCLGNPTYLLGEQVEPGRPIAASRVAAGASAPSPFARAGQAALAASPASAVVLLTLLIGNRPRRLLLGLVATLAIAATLAGGGPAVVAVVVSAGLAGWLASAFSRGRNSPRD